MNNLSYNKIQETNLIVLEVLVFLFFFIFNTLHLFFTIKVKNSLHFTVIQSKKLALLTITAHLIHCLKVYV